uniref:Uncharacterized protein n=1 Tax=Solanum lycopersicum TaxID=4081 RepID=A0A3Q7ED36_SOLLC
MEEIVEIKYIFLIQKTSSHINYSSYKSPGKKNFLKFLLVSFFVPPLCTINQESRNQGTFCCVFIVVDKIFL